jgi:hypothetical protein
MLIKKVGKKAFVNLFAILLLLALLAAIYLQAYMGTFSRYLADDYCTAGLLKQYGYWGSISNRFFTWDGRYSFSILIFLFDIFGNKFTSVLPSIAITLLLGGTFFLFAQISKRIFTKSNYLLLFLLSSIFVFTLIFIG